MRRSRPRCRLFFGHDWFLTEVFGRRVEVVVTTTAVAREGKIGRGSMYVVIWRELGSGGNGWRKKRERLGVATVIFT